MNPSLLASTVDLRFSAGRLYGARRAREEGWSWARRLLYVAGGPLIPLVRIRRVVREHLTDGSYAALRARVCAPLLFGLAVDALGQMAGYLAGPGRTVAKLATFEMDRMQHLTRADRRALGE